MGITFLEHSLARVVCITNINYLFVNYDRHKADVVARVTVKKENTSLLRVVDKLHLSAEILRRVNQLLVRKIKYVFIVV